MNRKSIILSKKYMKILYGRQKDAEKDKKDAKRRKIIIIYRQRR